MFEKIIEEELNNDENYIEVRNKDDGITYIEGKELDYGKVAKAISDKIQSQLSNNKLGRDKVMDIINELVDLFS